MLGTHPFTCIIARTTGSGKSTFCVRFLQNLSSLCKEERFKGGILLCFSERTSIPTGELDALNVNIRYHERVPMDFKNTRGVTFQFILDDLLNDAYSSGLVWIYLRMAVINIISASSLSRRTYSISPTIIATFH